MSYEKRKDIIDVLLIIKYRHDHCNWHRLNNLKCFHKLRSSKYYIFNGSYDVIENEDDAVKNDIIMDARLNEARDLGLIINESGNKEWHFNENWILTDLGKKYLEGVDTATFKLDE